MEKSNQSSQVEIQKARLKALIEGITEADRIFIFTQEGPRADGERYQHVQILIERNTEILGASPEAPEMTEEEDIFHFPDTEIWGDKDGNYG